MTSGGGPRNDKWGRWAGAFRRPNPFIVIPRPSSAEEPASPWFTRARPTLLGVQVAPVRVRVFDERDQDQAGSSAEDGLGMTSGGGPRNDKWGRWAGAFRRPNPFIVIPRPSSAEEPASPWFTRARPTLLGVQVAPVRVRVFDERDQDQAGSSAEDGLGMTSGGGPRNDKWGRWAGAFRRPNPFIVIPRPSSAEEPASPWFTRARPTLLGVQVAPVRVRVFDERDQDHAGSSAEDGLGMTSGGGPRNDKWGRWAGAFRRPNPFIVIPRPSSAEEPASPWFTRARPTLLGVQVAPVRVRVFDERDLLCARPPFDLLLPSDRIMDGGRPFVVNESPDVVAADEAGRSLPVLGEPVQQIARDSGVEDGARTEWAGQDVDGESTPHTDPIGLLFAAVAKIRLVSTRITRVPRPKTASE